MTDAHVAVLLPTYEPHPPFLVESLECLLAQTERRWTCLINDDASSVDVRAIVAPYLADPRIAFSRNTRRLGIGGNWNACLQNSISPRQFDYRSRSGPEPLQGRMAWRHDALEGRERGRVRGSAAYIQFLFQDDIWSPSYLERSRAVLDAHSTVGFVACAHAYRCTEPLETAEGYRLLEVEKEHALRDGPYDGREFLRKWLRDGLEHNVIGEPSFVMMRRSLVEEVGPFSAKLMQLLDVEYWVRALLCADWYYITEELGTFRVHRRGASYRHFRAGGQLREHLLLMEKLRSAFPAGTPLWLEYGEAIDQRCADIVSHVVNRLLRGQRIGVGVWPFLRHVQRHPTAGLRGLRRYAVQATRRWQKRFTSKHSSAVP